MIHPSELLSAALRMLAAAVDAAETTDALKAALGYTGKVDLQPHVWLSRLKSQRREVSECSGSWDALPDAPRAGGVSPAAASQKADELATLLLTAAGSDPGFVKGLCEFLTEQVAARHPGQSEPDADEEAEDLESDGADNDESAAELVTAGAEGGAE